MIFFTPDPVVATESLFSAGAAYSSAVDGRSKRNLGRLIDDDSFGGDNEDDNKGPSSDAMVGASKEAGFSNNLVAQEETAPSSITMVKGSNGDESFQENP